MKTRFCLKYFVNECGYLAFTGCDFTASFSCKGKVNLLKKYAMAIKVFSEIEEKETVNKK